MTAQNANPTPEEVKLPATRFQLLAKHPILIPFTLALMAGIALDDRLEPGWPWLVVTAGIGVAVMFRWKEGIVILAVALGMLLHYVHRVPLSAYDLRGIAGEAPDYFEFEGRVAGEQVVRQSARLLRVDFPLNLSKFRTADAWQEVRGTVWVEWDRGRRSAHGLPRLHPGDRVRVTGYLSRPAPSTNPHLFDRRAYLARQGIYYVLQIDRDDPPVERLGEWPGVAAFFGFRDRLEEALLRRMDADDETRGLVLGMILGQRAEMHPEVNDQFRRTGTLHVVAISGLHITLIAFIVSFALRMLRLSRRSIACIVIPFLIAYVVMTGCRPSAVRALLMCGVFMGSWLVNRPAHLMNSVAVAALLILAFAPAELFDAGFQLSFLVVASLVLLTPGLRAKMEPWIGIDPFLPRELVSPRRRAVSRTLGWTGDLAAVSLAAWIGSVGLILYYFHLFSPVALVCNLVVVPLASLSLALGFVAMALDFLLPAVAGLINQSQWLVTRAMLVTTEWGAAVPGGHFYLGQPPLWMVFSAYLAGWAAVVWKSARWWIVGATMLTAAILFGSNWIQAAERIVVLEVGGGQAVLIERFGGPKILVDAGSESEARWTVEPFLRARGIRRLDAVVATHGDASHVGGLITILKTMPVGEVVVSPARTRSSKFKQLLKTAGDLDIPVRQVQAGDRLAYGDSEFEVLWPKPPFATRADDNSLVLRHNSLLLLADLPVEFEDRIEAPAEAVVIRGAASRDLFKGRLADRTRVAIFSSEDKDRGDLVLDSTLERLRSRRTEVWITGRDGALIIERGIVTRARHDPDRSPGQSENSLY